MSRPWMPLYVSDYLGDTAHLSTTEHGAYLLLMMHYWQRGSLPDDDDRLARIAGSMRIEDWLVIKPTIQAFFHSGWRHKRIDAEMEKSHERSKAGRLGGRPKANEKQNESKLKAPLLQPHKDGGGGDAREPSNVRPLVSAKAIDLAEKIAVLAGVGPPADWPPGWCGAPMRVQTMLDQGWQPEVMLAATREAAMKKRDGPPDSVNYFEKPFARAHARVSAPLPVVTVDQTPEQIHEGSGRNPTGSAGLDFSALGAQLRARAAAGSL